MVCAAPGGGLRYCGPAARLRGGVACDRFDLSALPPDALEEADLVFLVLQPASLLINGAKGHNRLACDVIRRARVKTLLWWFQMFCSREPFLFPQENVRFPTSREFEKVDP